MATSALRSTSPDGLSAAPGATSVRATPTLAVSAICWSATRNGSAATALTSRSAISVTSTAPTAFSIRTANSSPPQRATVSWTGTTARNRRAAWARTRSPAPWPTESLTAVKRSRSRKMTPA